MDTPNVTPGAPTPGTVADPRLMSALGTATSSKHSVESLMEYIKKQKVIIKKKQAEIDSLANSSQGIGDNPLEMRAMLLGERLKAVFRLRRKLRNAFDQWRTKSYSKCLSTTKEALSTQTAANAALEQRVAKLKILLARTHSANQKNIEDSNALKREEKKSKEELLQLKMREESELKMLKEAQRASSLETAFKYDTERQIAEAVANVIATRSPSEGTVPIAEDVDSSKSSSSFSSGRPGAEYPSEVAQSVEESSLVSELREEVKMVTVRLKELEVQSEREAESALQQESDMNLRIKHLEASHGEMVQTLSGAQNTLKSENALRKELELELEQLMLDRSRLVREVREAKETKDRLVTLEADLAEKNKTVEELTKCNQVLEDECKLLRRGHNNVSTIEAENKRLHAMVRDFTGRGAVLNKANKQKNESPSMKKELAANPQSSNIAATVRDILGRVSLLLHDDARRTVEHLDAESALLISSLVILGDKSCAEPVSSFLSDDKIIQLCAGHKMRIEKHDAQARIDMLQDQLKQVEERLVRQISGSASSQVSGSISIEDELDMKEALAAQISAAEVTLARKTATDRRRSALCSEIKSHIDTLLRTKRRVEKESDAEMRVGLSSVLRDAEIDFSGTTGSNSQSSGQPHNVNPSEVFSFTADNVTIKARDDLKIPITFDEGVNIQWSFKLKDGTGDIGFAIMKQRGDSSLDFISDYKRLSSGSGEMWLPNTDGVKTTWHVLFDNSYSWMRQKDISYNITVERFGGDSNIEVGGDDDSSVGSNARSTSDIFKEVTIFLAKQNMDEV